MELLLQLWGGGFYLLNKIFFALAEGKPDRPKRRLRIFGWSVYLLGVPAWVIILAGKHDWVAAAIEGGGLPAMLFGLYSVCRGAQPSHPLWDRVTALFTYSVLLLGFGYSLHDFGGLTELSQLLEFGVMTGFLLGTYLLARQNHNGWLCFMLMNISMASLMGLQGKPLLAAQQLASLGFALYGFTAAMRSTRKQLPTEQAS